MIILPRASNVIDRFVMSMRAIPGLERISNLFWSFWGVAAAAIISILFKVSLLSAGIVPFNADEAVVALMARHILKGERPIFFYGQAYMGSLDAYLVAIGFYSFGEQVWVIRLIQILLYCGVILTSAWMARRLSGGWAALVITAWLLAVPAVYLSVYTTVSLGGYGEMLLIGNLILLLTIDLVEHCGQGGFRWFALGCLSGLGLWAFGMTLVYSLAAMGYLIWVRRTRFKQPRAFSADNDKNPDEKARSANFLTSKDWRKTVGLLLAGIVLGSAPWWFYAAQYGFQGLIGELAGGAIAGVEKTSYLVQVSRHILNVMLFGSTVIFGMRPPWEIRWLAFPLIPFAITFWVAVIIFTLRRVRISIKEDHDQRGLSHLILLAGVGVLLLVGFILTPFGADPSGRYFLPLGVLLSICAGLALAEWRTRWPWLSGLAVLFLLAFNFWGTIQVARANSPGLTTQIDAVAQLDHRDDQALIEFLRQNGENRGYTNYWVSYPLAFQSREELIFTPRLPYHLDFRYTSRDDRYAPYHELVSQADRVAYITSRHPQLDNLLRQQFVAQGVSWREQSIGDYRVFYQLSRPIHPEDLGIGAEK
jgi:4-amino-4-deoxy-L-arabinose transferase-like glycosyltransferase